MSSVRAAFGAPERAELTRAAALAAGTALVAFLGVRQLGAAGILAPLALVLLLIVLQRPVGAMALLFVLTVVCEGPTFGFLHFTSHLYVEVYKGLTLLDMLVVVAILAVGLDVLGRRRAVYIPRPLMPMAAVLLLAMVAGAITGSAHGQSLRAVTLLQNLLAYLLLLPIAVANLDLNRRKIALFLGCVMALAAIKAVFGLIEIASGQGASIEGTARLTYYEPTANWLIMLSFFAVCAALVGKVRLPRWMLACSPAAADMSDPVLSALILDCGGAGDRAGGAAGPVADGTEAVGAGGGACVCRCVAHRLGLSAVSVPGGQALRIACRLESRPERPGRYRNDERANVLRYIRKPHHGLGINVPWSVTARTLSVEHEEGRLYVHFAALWFWLKLGILGLVAYMLFIGGALVLSWSVWRVSAEPVFRVFGLASLAGWLGLIPIEATATFTGVDPRFTVLVGIQLGSIGAAGAWQTQCHESWRTCVGMERPADRAMRLLRTATRPRRVGALWFAVALQAAEVASIRLSRRSASGRVLGRGRNRRAGFHT